MASVGTVAPAKEKRPGTAIPSLRNFDENVSLPGLLALPREH